VRAGERIRLAVALIAIATSAHADYKDSYMRGKRAYEDGDYAKAHELLQQALSEHAEPSARFNPYGKVYTPYIPQHYLGLVALKQGDCAGVRTQWGSSDNRQIMLQLPDIAVEEEKSGATCAGKIAANPPAETAPAKPPVAEASKTLTPPVEKPPLRPEPAPPKVEPAPQKPVVANESVKPAPPPKPIEKPPEKTAPPDALVQAFEQFLSGRYAEAGKINAENYSDVRARFHAYLVRAAAKYTQARMAGDDALLQSARTDAAAARALDARAAPDAVLFSPAFREFYGESLPKP